MRALRALEVFCVLPPTVGVFYSRVVGLTTPFSHAIVVTTPMDANGAVSSVQTSRNLLKQFFFFNSLRGSSPSQIIICLTPTI